MTAKIAEKKLYEIVGRRIQDVRRGIRPRLRQEDVADRCDRRISRSSIANVERGHQSITLHQLYVIADVLGVEPASLLPTRNDVIEHAKEFPGHLGDPEKELWVSKIKDEKVTKR